DGTGNGADALKLTGVAVSAHLDRPMAADGQRIPFHSSSAAITLVDSGAKLGIELGAPADLSASQPAAIALTNALLRLTPADGLVLFGVTPQARDVTDGALFLGFGLMK
ncbi:MAG TPA: hypothetical protein VFB24_09430, partial [Candidatus Binatia bacterium]|nr:hypothetical protein [Candidatus Binatia bacterium]